MKKIIFTLCVSSALIACNKKIEWVATTPDVSWEQQDPASVEFIKSDAVDAVIDVAHPLQTIDGFGTCFNELGWTSLSELNEADRETIMQELFTPGKGANFTVCRMAVGANDFSRDWYSYNETDGDFEMRNFSIDNDKETLVPFIRNALKYNPDIKIWASPWSPPAWMKDNKHYACKPLNDPYFDIVNFSNDMLPEQKRAEGYNMFIQEDAYFEAYALYFAKFIEAYRAENINISMVMPQNEFNSCQPFPSCTWQASALAKFVGGYLGAKMKELGVDIMFGTMERPNPALVDTLLQDAESSKYITGVGFQWAGKEAIGDIHKRYPGLKIYQTEQECGDGKNTWGGAVYSWGLLKHYLLNGANVYEYWNTSLEDGGMSRWGWTQNSLVTVNKEAKTYKYTYEYYVMKHASHYVLPGAQLLPVSGSFTDLLAFKNTNGSYVLIIHNDQDVETKRTITLGNKTIAVTLKPQSFNTIAL
jgi:glucosylceramidase